MNMVTSLSNDADISRTKFLVVDSKPMFRDMAHAALASLRALEIKQATDVNEAVTVLKQHGRQIGGIICDWDLAPVGGLELLRQIRSRTLSKVNPEICAVLLTGRADGAAMRAAMLLDVNGVAIAPLSMEKLVHTLSQAMSRPWKLQSKEHYLKVPVIQASAVDTPNTPVSGREIWRRDVGAQEGVRSQTIESPAPKPLTTPTELRNI
jgi:two-component system chemotaxis response regulator CheY